MHMSDALLSLPVAGTFWALSAGTLALASRKLKGGPENGLAPRMGVLAAFVFAAQMINFSIPLTGSSGHFAGGVLLCLLLGPWGAFLALASVLAVQALFFADGGLLALGCNLFNMGFIPCFLAVPLVYRPLAGGLPSPRRRRAALVAACMVACGVGALSVTLQTTASGVSALPFWRFAALMVPVHLAIGVVEGLITVAVLEQVGIGMGASDFLQPGGAPPAPGRALGGVLAGMGTVALATAGLLSWFASPNPDGLEYSVRRLGASLDPPSLVQGIIHWQWAHAVFPDYAPRGLATGAARAGQDWPAVSPGTSAAGLAGAGIVFAIVLAFAWILERRRR
jgi:cobalt/nickel transport system permease protein